MSAADILKANKTRSSFTPATVLRSGYYQPTVKAFEVKEGTSTSGNTWKRFDFQFLVTGPSFSDPKVEATATVRHQYFFPNSPLILDKDKNPRTKKDGSLVTQLPTLASMMLAAGAPEQASRFESIDEVVEGIDGDSFDTLEDMWPAIDEYFTTVMSFYNRVGNVYAGGVKYLSGMGGEAKITNPKDGKDLYDNAEVKEFLDAAGLAKHSGSIPTGSYDQTRYQYIKSQMTSSSNSDEGTGSTSDSSGPRSVGGARPALTGVRRAGR